MPMMMIAAITTIATAPMISWVRLLVFDVRACATDFREIDCCLPLASFDAACLEAAGFEAAEFAELPPEDPLLFLGPVGLPPLLPCATVLSSSPWAHPCPALRHRRAIPPGHLHYAVMSATRPFRRRPCPPPRRPVGGRND